MGIIGVSRKFEINPEDLIHLFRVLKLVYILCWLQIRVNNAMKLGLKVGLGTDVAGGISPSMLTAIRMAVVNSRCLRAHKLAIKGGVEVTPDMEVGVEMARRSGVWGLCP